MYDRNVKSERILTKLPMLDYKYICDRTAKFHKKILLITRVINNQILTTKYFSFQYSITYCSQALRHPAHRARETVHLFTHETPDFITPALWPANSPDLNQVDYQIWWKLQERVYRSHVTSTSWSHTWLKSGNIFTRWSSMKWSGSGVHVFEFAFEHTVDILNTDFRCADVLPSAQTHTWQSITPVPIVDTYAFEWPY